MGKGGGGWARPGLSPGRFPKGFWDGLTPSPSFGADQGHQRLPQQPRGATLRAAGPGEGREGGRAAGGAAP